MDDRALIQQQVAGSRGMLLHSVGDVSDDEARRVVHPALSPIIWQVGHLGLTNVGFMQRAGIASPPSLPEAYPALFKAGTGGRAEYPPLDEVVRVFDATHEALLGVLAEADLDAPNEGPRGLWANLSGLFAFSVTHRWYHIGKITSLRALLGKPRLFG
ncbi:MAG: DinB family protein [bacterium]